MKNAPVSSAVCSDSTGTTLSYPFRGTEPITSYYGNRINPVTGVSELHNGIDFGMNYADVIAPADGIIQTVTWDASGGGNMMVIWHPQLNLRTGYLHLSQMLMRPGDTVQLEQKFAISRNTGTATTGPHLHFSVLTGQYGNWASTAVEPLQYMANCANEGESVESVAENNLPEECLGNESSPWGGCRFTDSDASLEIYMDSDGNITDTKALQPYPYINYIEQTDNGNNIYGNAPHRLQKMNVRVNRRRNRFCWTGLLQCYKSEIVRDYRIPYSFVELFKLSGNSVEQIEQIPNTGTSAWSINDPNGTENDTYFAIWKVHGKFDYYNPDSNRNREYDFLYELKAISERGNYYQTDLPPGWIEQYFIHEMAHRYQMRIYLDPNLDSSKIQDHIEILFEPTVPDDLYGNYWEVDPELINEDYFNETENQRIRCLNYQSTVDVYVKPNQQVFSSSYGCSTYKNEKGYAESIAEDVRIFYFNRAALKRLDDVYYLYDEGGWNGGTKIIDVNLNRHDYISDNYSIK